MTTFDCYICGAEVSSITYSRQYLCEGCFDSEMAYFIAEYDETVLSINGQQFIVGNMPVPLAEYICMLHNTTRRK